MAYPLLVNRYSRTQPFDLVNVRLFHLAQELAGVSREGFDITSLTLGKNSVERKGGFAGAGDTRDDHQFITRNLHVDVLKIMLARTPYDNFIEGHKEKMVLILHSTRNEE